MTFREPLVESDHDAGGRPETLDSDEARSKARQKLITGADASSSQAITRVGWKQWVIYCEDRGRSPWLDTVTPNEAEVLVLDWIAHLTYVLKRAASTVRGKVGAISLSHVVEGRGNPIDAMDRVRRAFRTLKRMSGGPKRKVPAGPPMLRAAIQRSKATMSGGDTAMIAAALTNGFCFMWRCGEFLNRGGQGWDESKVIRGADVRFRKEGRYLSEREPIDDADEVVVFQRGAKADQYNVGSVRNHFKVVGPGDDLCPVKTLIEVMKFNPKRRTSEGHLPLFRWCNGKPMTRDQVRITLSKAAEDVGYPLGSTSIHSLRSGGASALYESSGGNTNLVKRMGRWASDCFEGYLWETRTMSRGLAQGMVNSTWDLHAASLLDMNRFRAE